MSVDNEAIMRRWLKEVWNEGKEETIDELFSENGSASCPLNSNEAPIRGIKEFKKFFGRTGSLFADVNISIEELFAEDERVVALCKFSAKRREFQSDGEVILKPICVSGLYQIKIRAGKIYEIWNNFDFQAVNEKLDSIM